MASSQEYASQTKAMILTRTVERILRARVYDVAIESPLDSAPGLSVRLQNRILLKREDLQPVFSFKLRGAYNRMIQLDEKSLAKGVIAASAGNHAQGVALAAQKLKTRARIVMPQTTPGIKVEAVRRLGAEAILVGDAYDDAYQHAIRLAEEEGVTFIHPYDDPDVIAGQGTIGMEILRQHPGPIHAVFIPVGGGGLIAGVAAYIKFVRPEVRIIGVEPEDSDCLARALKAGRRVTLRQVGLFADGVAVRQIGKEPFHLAHTLVDEVVTVSTDEICAAIKDIFDDTRSIAETAGALGVAGAKKYIETTGIRDQTLVPIISGANINFNRLRHVAERAEVGEKRERLMAVTIPERPGSFLAFLKILGRRGITEFNYRYFDGDVARVFVGIDAGRQDSKILVQSLEEAGYPVLDMSENTLAVEHIRYMVGGHAPTLTDEVVYSFEFPERPGALLAFLSSLEGRWNISLFHYRNHGAAYGRVLMGIEVPKAKRKEFRQFLEETGFVYQEESQNPAYRLFAGGSKTKV
jgi:threonine dehydratase